MRTFPVARGGKIEGFRVSGTRPGSLLTLLGIRNGDVIESFDGKDLSTPARALEAYAVLMNRSSERLTLGIRRGGAPVIITYRLN
jgi:general secretion pathway protein C